MNTHLQIHQNNNCRKDCAGPKISRLDLVRLTLIAMVSLVGSFLASPVQAQTVAINPQTINYWAGVNTTNLLGVGSNSVAITGADTSTYNLAVTGQPSGLTTVLSTNSCTNSIQLGLYLSVTNVAAGAYPLTISATGEASYSTNANFFVVPQWSQTNSGSYGNWSDSTKWSGGVAPSILGSDSAYLESTIDVPYTNVVDSSRTVQSLVLIADQGSAAADIVTVITNGATLSVIGTNGMYIGIKQTAAKRPGFFFLGGGALVINNTNANFAANSGSASSSANGPTVNMTNLSTFSATVNRFGAGDGGLNSAGLFGGELVNFFLAKTNTITTSFVDNYSNLSFDCAFQFQCNKNYSSGSLNELCYLGMTNGFYVDSLAVGRAKGTGGVTLSGGGSTLKFGPAFANSASPFATAYFRGPKGGTNRVSLVAVGVDSGLPGTTLANTVGTIDLRGGQIDMLVDKIWLGHNRTNATANTAAGAFLFDWGNVNANTVEVGYMQFTNAATVAGYFVVSTNGTLVVNNNIELGHTPSDNIGFPGSLAAASGQLMVTNGGTIRASQITVGQYSTNNVIIVAPNSSLVVSNAIANASQSLTTLNLNGGALTFSVNAGVTNAYVTNLLTTTTATKINIASAPAGQSTNVLIVYQAANQTPNISIGTLPPGFNNMQIVVGATTVSLIVSTNQPKNLVWRGGQNSQWDHGSLNWLDLNTLAITKFTDGDSVTFDDTAAVPTSITIAENVNPGQSGTGILVTNSVNSFTFNNSGAGAIGSCLLVKKGANGLEVDATTSVGAQVNNGTLTVGLTGTIANATTAAGTTLNNLGTLSGGVTCSGALQNSGSIDGSLSILTPSSVVNSGTVSGNVSLQSGTLLNNSGLLNSIGATIIPTNSTLINGGTIYGASLTVSVGGILTDTVPGSSGVSPGSINVGTLTVNGAFNPGGGAIQTTKVTDYANDTVTQQGNPNGRIQLSAGSITVLQVNSTNTPSNTLILSQNQGFGPSQVTKAIDGCTLVITNLGPPLSAGQTFQFFGAYYTAGNIGNAGLNTTNAYPIIQPSIPGPGLVWDLSNLIPGGTIGVISASSVQMTLTNNMTIIGTNIVTELTWPAGFTGNGWVQQQITTLSTGLGTNWSNVGPSAYVNDIFLTNVISADSAVFYRFIIP
jgi:hypothetical protein